MDAKESMKDIADFVVDLLTDERGPKHQSHPNQPTEPAHHVDPNASHFVTEEDLGDALDRAMTRFDDHDDDGPVGGGLRGLLGSQGGPAAPHAAAAAAAPVVRAAAPQPQPQPVVREVVRNVVHERVIHEPQVTHVTEQVHTTNQTFLREGDKIVDNRTINNIHADGEDIDIDINQMIDNETVIADHGGVAVGGDLKNSPVNTGKFNGVQSSGDVDADEAVIGDKNTVVQDSEVGAMAQGGDATNVNAKNANLGRDQTVVETDGDGPVAVGKDIDQRGDVEIDIKDVEGNADLAVGDKNDQAALQDNSETTSHSGNLSEQTTVTDNDDFSQHDSNNLTEMLTEQDDLHLEDNDRSTEHLDSHIEDTDQHVDLFGDDNDVDLDD